MIPLLLGDSMYDHASVVLRLPSVFMPTFDTSMLHMKLFEFPLEDSLTG